MPDSGPRSGKLAPKKVVPKKGKPKMSAEKWAKLSKREKEVDYNGSRFSQVGAEGTAKEAGHKDRRVSTRRGYGGGERGRSFGRGHGLRSGKSRTSGN
jgi:hypothetical protein